MAKKHRFEVREVDGWQYEDGWVWNSSFYAGEFSTNAETATGQKKAFTNHLRKRGIVFKINRTLIEETGDVYEIVDRRTKEPLYAALLIMEGVD